MSEPPQSGPSRKTQLRPEKRRLKATPYQRPSDKKQEEWSYSETRTDESELESETKIPKLDQKKNVQSSTSLPDEPCVPDIYHTTFAHSVPQLPVDECTVVDMYCGMFVEPAPRVSSDPLDIYVSKLSSETLFETAVDELDEVYEVTEAIRNIQLSANITDKAMKRLLEIAEPYAKFFACCEVTVTANTLDRISTLPEEPVCRSLALQLTRAASFLRRNVFRKGKLLGKGVYGSVYLTRTQYAPKEYALKEVKINIPGKSKSSTIRGFMSKQIRCLRERDAMLIKRHPFICKLSACWVEKSRKTLNYYFLMEYAPFGDLLDFIVKVLHPKRLPIETKVFDNDYIIRETKRNRSKSETRKKLFYIYSAEMASALYFLHLRGIVHRDFKPGNILIGADYHLRVTDFGFVNPRRAFHSFEFHSTKIPLKDHPAFRMEPMKDINIPEYRAGAMVYCYTPEILREYDRQCYEPGHRPIDTNQYFTMDMWALGVTMYELYSGVQPFREPPETEDTIKAKVIDFRQNRFLNKPLFPVLIDKQSYRRILRKLITQIEYRVNSQEVLKMLNKKVKKLSGKTVEELSMRKLDFMIEFLGPVKPTSPADYATSGWSPNYEGASSTFFEGPPAMGQTFPYSSHTPKYS